jgi:hypothetical protein
MNEYIVVKYLRMRQVLVDGEPAGMTGEKLIVTRGHHAVRLAGPQDYAPPSWNGDVVDHPDDDPLKIEFTPAVSRR